MSSRSPEAAADGLARRWAALSPQTRRDALADARTAVGLAPAQVRAAWSTRDQPTVDAIVNAAYADHGRPWPQLTLSAYARYWRDGVRTAFEEPAAELRRRTAQAVLAAALSGEQVLLDEAADGLLLLCEQSTWCWAAHERFAAQRGEVVPDQRRPFLDLGAAETVAILAWADLVLDSELDRRVPGLRRRLRREAWQRVIEPFLRDRTWHWLGLDGPQHNWSPWIHGHVLAAALFLADDPEVQLAAVDLVVAGLDRYLAAQPHDGGCDEGFAYWWHGPARLFEAVQLLDTVTAGAFAPWDCDPLPELARYPQRVALGDDWFVNVGDCVARSSPAAPWHVLHRWGRSMGDQQVMDFAAAYRVPGRPLVDVAAGLGRAVLGLHDEAWATAVRRSAPVARSCWLADVQLLISRERGGSTGGLAMAVKGGHNAENHNHNDVGSYLVALHGTPVLIDLGQPTYTAISFTDRRYEQWVTQSEWHNLPLINGVGQSPGADFGARRVTVELTPDTGRDALELDLNQAYPSRAGCRSWRRRVCLDRRQRAVIVHDGWTVDDPAEVRLHHVIAGDPVRHRPGELVVRSLAGALLVLSWDERSGAGELQDRAVDDPLLSAVWGGKVHRLVLTPAVANAGEFTLVVREGTDEY